MLRTVLTTAADIIGAAALAAFAWLVWRPAAALLVVGVACLVASYVHARPAARSPELGEL